jgi:RNA polymerase sigma-70 factor (family 1)
MSQIAEKLPDGLKVMGIKGKKICEEELISRVQSGDKSALAEIYDLYFIDLCNFSYRFVKRRSVCQELVQDLFLSIWKNRKDWCPEGNIRSYLFKAIKNQSLDYLKHLSVEHKFADYYRKEEMREFEYPEPLVLIKRTNELECAIHQAIESLPEKRKVIFKMSREDGLTYYEIAQVMDISVKTVETQMGRSLKTLRKLLSGYLPGIAVLFSNIHNLL